MMEAEESCRWGARPFELVMAGLIPIAAIVLTVFEPWAWPAILLAVVPLILTLRVEIRLTPHEVILRYPIGSSTTIPRSEVAFAQFNYRPTGTYLEIHRHNGWVHRILFSPKYTSSELSGDPPPPDSVAYQITEWAKSQQP